MQYDRNKYPSKAGACLLFLIISENYQKCKLFVVTIGLHFDDEME